MGPGERGLIRVRSPAGPGGVVQILEPWGPPVVFCSGLPALRNTRARLGVWGVRRGNVEIRDRLACLLYPRRGGFGGGLVAREAVSETSCGTGFWGFDFRDGKMGLSGKELRLVRVIGGLCRISNDLRDGA